MHTLRRASLADAPQDRAPPEPFRLGLRHPVRASLKLATVTSDGNIRRWVRSDGKATSSSPGRGTTAPATCTSTRTASS
jgi:hypothetical protein